MQTSLRFLFICLSLYFWLPASQAKTQDIPGTIILATTDWCPYACEKEPSKKGIVHDYIEHLVAQQNRNLELVFLPWARAVQEVNNGNNHGLLTAVPAEAPNLLFTRQPLMAYQMCFYGLADATWRYKGHTSLSSTIFGVMANYGYGEPLDSFVSNYRNTNVVKLAGSDGLERLVAMLEKGRLDSFVADSHVIDWHLKQRQKAPFQSLGCLSQNPFYLALSPKLPWAAEFLASLDKALADTKNRAWLAQQIKIQYQ